MKGKRNELLLYTNCKEPLRLPINPISRTWIVLALVTIVGKRSIYLSCKAKSLPKISPCQKILRTRSV